MPYEHIKIVRDEPVRERHPRKFVPRNMRPEDVRSFGSRLQTNLIATAQRVRREDVTGFDSRLLLKIVLRDDVMLPQFDAIPGIEIVSHEDKSIVLTFATEPGLREFESRLSTLASTEAATRSDILFAIENFDRWTSENRKGSALIEQGFPDQEAFLLDVELWPLEDGRLRPAMLESFEAWALSEGCEVLDRLSQPSLVMFRLRVRISQTDAILNHRDVRTVDLPPRVGLELDLLIADVNQFPQVQRPSDNSPRIGVLDSGLTAGHPLLSPALGDAQGFVAPHRNTTDDPNAGHGTFVAGLALYGDVAEQIRQGQFIPELQLFSGKVFNDDGTDQTVFVEKAVEEAVQYFFQTYQCRVFNLSYGDYNKVYDGRHLRGLAYTLDRLTRDLGVLFVVPTGNLLLSDLPIDPVAEYPSYLLQPHARLLEPAPALNAITVGGLARFEASFDARRNDETIEDVPIARALQPSPFTRAGLSVGKAVKPDFAEEAGNLAFVHSRRNTRSQGLGIVSMNSGFAFGRPFRESHGTSFAAPKIAHIAARIASRFQDNSVNLVRAILASHASWPTPSISLLNPNQNAVGVESLLRLVGYGKVSKDALIESESNVVTLYAEDKIDDNRNHFYELTLPDEFWSRGKRERQISISLAYSPEVRTTRLDYRRTKLSFSLVSANSLDEVADAFTRGRAQGLPERITGRSIPGDTRKTSTLQSSTWTFKIAPTAGAPKYFVVVTRQDANWSTSQDINEPYALSVVIRDRENTEVNLYVRIAAMVQARAQERERARIRV